MGEGRAPAAPDAVEVVLRLWLEHLRVERSASANTVSNYARDARRWQHWLAQQDISRLGEVTVPMVERYVRDLRDGDPAQGRAPLAVSSANRALVVVRQMHAFALHEGRVSQNVAAEVQPVQMPKHYPDTLTVEDACRIIDAIPTGETATAVDVRDRALLELLYGTGARITEVLSLRAQEGIGDRDMVLLHGKGDKERLVPLGEPARQAVREYARRSRPELAAKARAGVPQELFLNTLGRPLSRQSAWKVIKERAQRAGVTAEISPHTFRHSYATHLVQRGVPVRTVQELLGHAAVTTTQLYMHMNTQGIAEKWREAHPRA
ncbi:tyrosine recombinase XerD [Corynebacterium sp. 13CS0277]|uniref:tyrosine recombinase n=1 Tax=Corynebacterium sp. 13CS0277 TaxID=2071994 RepID=UPI000D025DDA|nr:tyrosine recombinase [Corynebacterium sp. 13CS0277]PRQ12014.1 tyrosine recombinase XerD [Corynebacterium sp. 13CS0277]